MMIKTNWHSFDAILRSETGEELAVGEASISLERKAVTFESDFVPLYPIGTPMEVVRLNDETEIHRFKGKVYISDKRLMRITSVEDELLPGSEHFYSDHINVRAILQSIQSEEPKKKTLFKKQADKPEEIIEQWVQITTLTAEKLIFQFEHQDIVSDSSQEEFCDIMNLSQPEAVSGDQYFIKIDFPLSLEAEIEILNPFYFGHYASYACRFINLTEENYEKISRFLWEYNLQYNKLF